MTLSEDSIKALESLAAAGALANLHGAIGALHDQLERAGALKDPHAHYLMLRLRREEVLVSGRPDAEIAAQHWQQQIEAMEKAVIADADRNNLAPVSAALKIPAIMGSSPMEIIDVKLATPLDSSMFAGFPGSAQQAPAEPHSRCIGISALDVSVETAEPRLIGATFVRAGERMGFGRDEPLQSARVVFHTSNGDLITSLSARTASGISGEAQFDVAEGFRISRKDAIRLRDWAGESLRRQDADGVIDGAPAKATRRPRP